MSLWSNWLRHCLFTAKIAGSNPVRDIINNTFFFMKNKKQIDQKRRQLYNLNEINNRILKILAYNTNLSLNIRWKYILKLTKLHKNSYLSKVHNFCVLTGRSKSVFKNIKLSRIKFRNKASFNKIVGISKTSW